LGSKAADAAARFGYIRRMTDTEHTHSAAIAIVAEANHEPMVGTTSYRVLDIVALAYRDGLPAADALAGADGTPIGRSTVVAAVNFCADRGCETAQSYCQGCRLATRAKHLETLDDFCRQFAVVETAAGQRLLGPGSGTLQTPSLEELARTWSGEQMFFHARRVHRRLHKEREPRPKRMSDGTEAIGHDEQPVVILVTPQMADNIGMSARAMANFGLDEMRLVNPRDGWPSEKARHAASGANGVIDAANAYADTKSALADLHWVIATTARQRHMNKPVLTPEQAAAELLERIEAGQRVGILFGPERQGLENDDIALADAVVMAPVDPRFASLNLAQAVLLLSYEWMKIAKRGTLGRVTTYEKPATPGLVTRGSPPATKSELIGFFEHLEAELDLSGFLKPPDKRPAMVRNIRTMFERMGATEQEVRTLRGIVAALTYKHLRNRLGSNATPGGDAQAEPRNKP
jgi:tRNA/rRNA methyltransferase